MTRSRETAVDQALELRRCWSLDMIVPLDAEAEAAGGDLLGRWEDLSVADLPPQVHAVALAQPASWRTIAEALTEPDVVEAACESFINDVQRLLVAGHGERATTIALARSGLTVEWVPTLEALGIELDLTRERVRQLGYGITNEVETALVWRAPLRLVLAAQFALKRGVPLTLSDLSPPHWQQRRLIQQALESLDYPELLLGGPVWTQTKAQRVALEALVDLLPQIHDARSLAELADVGTAQLPGISDVLDVESTLTVVAALLDIGPSLDGRFASGYREISRRVAGRVVTYLQRRAAPITPSDLAQIVRKGVPPFEIFHRPLVEPEWLSACARRNPDQLQLRPDGRIALSSSLEHRKPTGTIGTLHSIVVEHGQPLRMIDLCDRAAESGISRNQVGMLIHSGRAASLFMLSRGIVGLVGRDEQAAASSYQAATPGGTTRARVGEQIGLDDEGRIAVDIEVRRSVREQGLGLPWPFSIVFFSDRPELVVDGNPFKLDLRANGDVDVPQLTPGSRVRLRLAATRHGHRLSIETRATDTVSLVRDAWSGAQISTGLPSVADRPGWVEVVLAQIGRRSKEPSELLRQMPRRLTSKRRMRALYALIALGLVGLTSSGWRRRDKRQLPRQLADVFALLTADPTAYELLTLEQRAAAGWLVQATWLVPNRGWSYVRPNDLGQHASPAEGPTTAAPPSPREAALMRIVEAAHQANDLRRHPGETNSTAATAIVVRRYLIALGYTALDAVRERSGPPGEQAFSVRRSNGAAASAVWLLQPIGAGISDGALSRARKIARAEGAAVAVATDGIRLVAAEDQTRFEVDLRKIGKTKSEFARFASLAVDPDLLAQGRPT